MDKQRLEYFRDRLKSLRESEIINADNLKNGLRSTFQDSIGELSLYDNHPADVGDTTFEREKDLGLKLFAEDRLAMIEEALNNIDTGKYGLCEVCNREISLERLEAIPYTTFCQDCKRENEDRERHPRPIEEDVVALPYGGVRGRLLLDGDRDVDNNAFDGEDAWQSVARFGTSNAPSDIGGVEDYEDAATFYVPAPN